MWAWIGATAIWVGVSLLLWVGMPTAAACWAVAGLVWVGIGVWEIVRR